MKVRLFMGRHVKKIRNYMRGVLRGIASPGEVYMVRDYRNQTSPLDAMRGDWQKIGNDFRVVISRNGQAANQDQ
jgi:hypothetical protein